MPFLRRQVRFPNLRYGGRSFRDRQTRFKGGLPGVLGRQPRFPHQSTSLAAASGGYAISQYRDTKKREIDFLVERPGGGLLGIEVKAGIASLSDFKHLKWFAANLSPAEFTGIVLYSGSNVLRFGEGFYAVPLSALGA